MKLLIVDDDTQFSAKCARIAERAGLEIIFAEDVKEGIQKALAERPEAIITDKDMPDGTGNDVARAVRAVYSTNIAGLTGEDPNRFDASIDIRQSKDTTDENIKSIVDALLTHNPRDNYASPQLFQQTFVYYAAIDILIQGYIVAKALIEGKSPLEAFRKITPEFNGEIDAGMIRTPTREQADDVLTSAEIDYEELRRATQRISAVNKDFGEFAEKVQKVAEKIASKRIPEENELMEYHKKFAEYCMRM